MFLMKLILIMWIRLNLGHILMSLQPVLLVASPKDVIDSLLEISDALAWHTIGIDIEVLSAYRTLPRQLENFVLLDIGRSYSMLTIFSERCSWHCAAQYSPGRADV